jgi:hypothetical protein
MRALFMNSGAYEACQIEADGLGEETVLDRADALVERVGLFAILDVLCLV